MEPNNRTVDKLFLLQLKLFLFRERAAEATVKILNRVLGPGLRISVSRTEKVEPTPEKKQVEPFYVQRDVTPNHRTIDVRENPHPFSGTAREYETVHFMESKYDCGDLHQTLRSMAEDAQKYIRHLYDVEQGIEDERSAWEKDGKPVSELSPQEREDFENNLVEKFGTDKIFEESANLEKINESVVYVLRNIIKEDRIDRKILEEGSSDATELNKKRVKARDTTRLIEELFPDIDTLLHNVEKREKNAFLR